MVSHVTFYVELSKCSESVSVGESSGRRAYFSGRLWNTDRSELDGRTFGVTVVHADLTEAPTELPKGAVGWLHVRPKAEASEDGQSAFDAMIRLRADDYAAVMDLTRGAFHDGWAISASLQVRLQQDGLTFIASARNVDYSKGVDAHVFGVQVSRRSQVQGAPQNAADGECDVRCPT